MKLYKTLSIGLLQSHPEDAARVLEAASEDDALSILAAAPAAVASATLRRMAPHRATAVLEEMDCKRAAAIVEGLGPDLAVSLLRRMNPRPREALVHALAEDHARSVRTLLRYPEGTAGALMDPDVLALPGDLTVEAAHTYIRNAAENVRYNLYVLDREHRLIGVLNLRELLLARRKELLSSIANKDVMSIPATADSHAILTHPAWVEVRSVPVIDAQGVYLGALRYPTLRRLETELLAGDEEGGTSTVEALSELFSTGLVSVFGAVATSVSNPFPGGSRRDA